MVSAGGRLGEPGDPRAVHIHRVDGERVEDRVAPSGGECDPGAVGREGRVAVEGRVGREATNVRAVDVHRVDVAGASCV